VVLLPKRVHSAVEWIVHAAHCAKPDLTLRRVLERRGFVISKLPTVGEAYHKLEEITVGSQA